MGRFLAAGIPAFIHIYGKNEKFDKARLKKFNQKLAKYINLDMYEHFDDEIGDLYLLKDISKEDIYKTLHEFKKETEFNPIFFSLEDPSDYEKILSNDYKFELAYGYKRYNRRCNGILINDEFSEFDSDFYDEVWLYRDCDLTGFYDYDVEILIEYLTIWRDIEKIDIEDETNLLAILNKLKIKGFKNSSDLTKSILFYIMG